MLGRQLLLVRILSSLLKRQRNADWQTESVSERTEQPLYVVGCGDLGVAVNSVEEKLATIFQRATAWNAIVLLDEADVFLQQRTAQDLERNALVSGKTYDSR